MGFYLLYCLLDFGTIIVVFYAGLVTNFELASPKDIQYKIKDFLS